MEERADAIVRAALDCGRLHSDRAERVYRLLVTAALAHHVALRPEAKVTPNHHSFFLVLDELPALMGVSRPTVFRALDNLKAGGLVDRRAWFTSTKNQEKGQRCTLTGGVVDVILTPAQGTEARVRAEYLRVHYRDLDADRKVGRTAWQ